MVANEGGILTSFDEPTRNEIQAVGVTSAIIVPVRNVLNKRKVIQIRNTSDDDTKVITINLGSNPSVANAGIVLKRWEAFADSSETGYECWQGAITAISAVAGAQVSIFER